MLCVINRNDVIALAEKPERIELGMMSFRIFVKTKNIAIEIPCATLDGAKAFYKELLLNWDNPCTILTEKGDLVSIENFEI